MKIKVIQEDIDLGCRSHDANIYFCPIALAVKRKMNIERGVAVHQEDISIITIGQQFRYYKLPKKAKAFIKRFDEGKKVKPLSFEARKIK
jgi:hypothetical protein